MTANAGPDKKRGLEKRTGDGVAGVKVLSRAIAVLFAFSPQRQNLTLSDLSELLSINKPSLLRILRVLEDEKLLLRSEYTYTLGPKVLTLGNAYLTKLSTHEVARRHLASLATRCGQTVNLAMLDHSEVVYLAILHAQTEVGIQGEVGGRHPAHATSLGKVLLADKSGDELRLLYETNELAALTEMTITSREILIDHLSQVRERGYALDEQERSVGVRCIAAPIRDHTGAVIMAASVAGPIFNMSDQRLPLLRDDLLKTVNEISAEFGYCGELEHEVSPGEITIEH